MKKRTSFINGHINSQQNPELDAYVQERIELVLGKFKNRIELLEVRMKEDCHSNNVKRTCTIEVRLVSRGRIRVTATKDNAFAAVLAAIHNAETKIGKEITKHQQGQNLRHRRQGLRQDNRQWALQLAETF
ncbi:MAG: HPF/RaiA family ribosome-associated protein [Planctomycetales bacterium]|nr:HPF/RaiA family ribosome-associated protein [Planctomycetales bacterium]